MSNFTPTNDQYAVVKKVCDWFTHDSSFRQFYYLAGFAGTGKSVLANFIARELNVKVAYVAYTGKAALVMRKKGCVGARTIHSTIYKPKVNQNTGEVTFVLNDIISDVDLFIVDECSMVDNKTAMDLLSFGIPILALGDPAQLPPPSGSGYFSKNKPDSMMTEIHRQAAENPIIYLASLVREGEQLAYGSYGTSKVTKKFIKEEMLSTKQLLVGTNKTRHAMNERYRDIYGYEGVAPNPNERLICTKNTTVKETPLMNGELFNCVSISDKEYKYHYDMSVRSLDSEDKSLIKTKARKCTFDSSVKEPTEFKYKPKGLVDFDFAYALTTHKFQGSQEESVYIVDESHYFGEDWNKWLYTAITRAEETCIIYY